MKASLEAEEVEYRGVILESETPEEKEILAKIWTGHGRPVMFHQMMGGQVYQVYLVIAPTPQGEDIPRLPGKGEER